MDYTIDTLPSRLTLGRQTETGVNDIRIDMREWLRQWPGLAISIWPTRPGEKAAYPADTYMDGNSIIWRVNSADTAIAGIGTVQIMGVADEQKKLSKVINTYIASTTTGVTTDPPEAAKPWADSVAVSAASAQEAAQRAEDAASEIKGISAVAQTLKAGQAATAEYADGVLTLGIPEGAKGEQGPKGDKGDTGAAGPQGEPGRDGTDAEVTADSIRTALGYEPADAAAVDTKLTEPAEGLAVGKYFRVAAVDENGHAVLEAVDAKTVGVQDVQVNGASIVADGVASMPVANAFGKFGVVNLSASGGVKWSDALNALSIDFAREPAIANRSSSNNPLIPYYLDYAVKAAMCDGKGAAWTADEQAAARERMGIPGDYKLLRDITTEEDIEMINLGDVQSKDAILIIHSASGCGSTPYYRTSSGRLFYAGNGAVIYSVARVSRLYVETTARNSLNEYAACSELLADSVDANVGNLILHGNISTITAGTNVKIYVR